MIKMGHATHERHVLLHLSVGGRLIAFAFDSVYFTFKSDSSSLFLLALLLLVLKPKKRGGGKAIASSCAAFLA